MEERKFTLQHVQAQLFRSSVNSPEQLLSQQVVIGAVDTLDELHKVWTLADRDLLLAGNRAEDHSVGNHLTLRCIGEQVHADFRGVVDDQGAKRQRMRSDRRDAQRIG